MDRCRPPGRDRRGKPMREPTQVDTFLRYFTLSMVKGAALEEAFRVRYQVYCREFGYERAEDCPGGQESDAFDAQAWHCALAHRPSGMLAGYVRVVHAEAADPLRELPMEQHCRDSFTHPTLRPDRLDRDRSCEVSRLMVHGLFRRRRGEAATPFGGADVPGFPPEQQRTFPLVGVSLFVAATVLCVHHRKQHAFAMMEPSLVRILRQTGLAFTQVGEALDYHGWRAAYYIDSGDALAAILRSDSLRQLCEHAQEQLLASHPVALRAPPQITAPMPNAAGWCLPPWSRVREWPPGVAP